MSNNQKLTVEEALSQGYTRWLVAKGGFQSLCDLTHITDGDFDRYEIELVNKEPYSPPCYIDTETIRENLAEHCELQHRDETGDDTNQVYDAILELPTELFQPIIDAISSKMHGLNYYRGSGITLIRSTTLTNQPK